MRIALGSSCCYCTLSVDSVDVHTSSAVTTTLISITAALILGTRCAVLRTNPVCRLPGPVKRVAAAQRIAGKRCACPLWAGIGDLAGSDSIYCDLTIILPMGRVGKA